VATNGDPSGLGHVSCFNARSLAQALLTFVLVFLLLLRLVDRQPVTAGLLGVAGGDDEAIDPLGLRREHDARVELAGRVVVLGELLAGRIFEPSDERPGEPVAIVNQEFADRFFPGRSPLDARVRFDSPADSEHRIIGIVQNTAINSITEPAEPYFYLPYWRAPYGDATFLVKTSTDAAGLAPAVRDVLRTTDPALEARRVITMREYIDYSGSAYRATTTLAISLAALGLVLTVIGVYGVVAYRTARRAREIGIRMALGASRSSVLRLVLGEGALVATIGIAIGIPAAIAATREISSMLFHVGPSDAGVLAGTAALLFACVCAAATIPAWRATRVEPFESLRTP